MSVRATLEAHDLFDNTIYNHVFTDYMRDYQLLAYLHVGAGSPGTYTYLFQGCVEVVYESCLPTEAFSMDELFLDYQQWKSAGSPSGFVWGVKYATVYPGWKYVEPSPRAAQWTQRLKIPLHEVIVETNVYRLSLIFHDLIVTKSEKLGPC